MFASPKKFERFLFNWLSRYRKWLIFGFFLLAVVALFSWYTQIIEVRGEFHEAPRDTKARIYIHQKVSVGQSFQAPWPLKGIGIVLDGVKDLPGAFTLHLRKSPRGPDLRTVSIPAKELKLGETINFFEFEPLSLPAEETLYFFLEAPQIKKGQLWAFREIDSSIYPTGSLLRNFREEPGDLAFQLKGQVRKFVKITLFSDSNFPSFTSRDFQVSATTLIITLGSTLALFLIPYPLHRFRYLVPLLGLTLFILHLPFVFRWPAINDEGSYLLDVVQMSWGGVPFRNFLTKGPVFLFFLKSWQLFWSHSLLLARFFSVFVSILALPLLFFIAHRLSFSRRITFASVVLYSLSAGASAFSSHLLTQPLAIFWGLAGLCCLLSPRLPLHWRGRLGAIFVALAIFTRLSAVVFLPLSLLIIFWQNQQRKGLLKTFLLALLTTSLIIFLILFLLAGWPRVLVALNMESILVVKQHHQAGGIWLTYPPQEIYERMVYLLPPLWRSSALLVIFSLLAPFLLLRYWRAVPALAAALPVWLMWFWLWQSLPPAWRSLAGAFPAEKIVGTALLLLCTGIVLIPLGFLKTSFSSRRQFYHHGRLVLLGVFWVTLLLAVYTFWGKWRSNYFGEFLPPLALLAGFSFYHIWQALLNAFASLHLARFFVSLWWGGLLALTYLSFQYTLAIPHTGTMDLGSVERMRKVIERNVSPHEAIFTAQALFPAITRRPILPPFASHPGWILSDRRGEVPEKLRLLYFPPDDKLLLSLQKANYVLTDRRTNEVYFEIPALKEELENHFTLMEEVENISAPFRLWKRKR
jgi:hypothetical protein